jgi:putative transcriptional regulator
LAAFGFALHAVSAAYCRTGNFSAGWALEVPEARGAVGDVQEVGARIRAARKEAGLTQRDLADLAGISERTVRAIETGAGNPTLAAVVAAANVLGLRLAAG